MAEKVKFISKHDNMTIMRKPRQTTRSVNGVMQIVMEDRPPFTFNNGELVATEEEAKEIRAGRGIGSLYEEVPKPVKKVAEKTEAEKETEEVEEPEEAEQETEEPAEEEETAEDAVEPTVVDSVSDFNSASTYLKEEWGLEHKQVNSKAKVFAEAERLGIVFPNFTEEDS